MGDLSEKQLPEGWIESSADEILKMRMGKTILSRELTNTGLAVFSAGASKEPWGYLEECDLEFERGTVILSARGNIGFPIAPKIDKFVSTQTTIAIQPSPIVLPEYLKNYMSVVRWPDYTATTAIPMLTIGNAKKIRIILPPLAEQERIVDKIDELFSAIEAGERAIEQARAGVARYRKAILKAAVTGELTRVWRDENPTEESAEALLERILTARYEAWEKSELEKLDAKSKARPGTEKQWEKFRARYKHPAEPLLEELPDLPRGWVWASLAKICNIQGGVTVNRKREAKDPVTVPYLRVANVQAGKIDLTTVKEITVDSEKANAKLLRPGDILMNEGGDLDKLGRGWVWYGQIDPCIHQNHVFRSRPIIEELSSEYVSHNANHSIRDFCIKNGKQSVNLASISLTSISKFPTPLPPIEEQIEIVNRVELALSKADAVEATLNDQSRQAKALKQAVLKTAFEGKLVPQNPNDEPASELLKRIKAAS